MSDRAKRGEATAAINEAKEFGVNETNIAACMKKKAHMVLQFRG